MAVVINDWNDLDNVRLDYSGNYELGGNLDSSTAGYSGIGDNFDVLGPGYREWGGSFNGNGYVISEITINDGADWGTALIGHIEWNSSIEIKNLGVVGEIPASTSRATGGIVGRQDHGLISNCFADVEVHSDGNHVGGLIGDANRNIENSYSIGDVYGYSTNNTGGFIGRCFADITNCYSHGNVTGGTNVGGFYGGGSEYNGSLTNCYSTGFVSNSDDYEGGFVGRGYMPTNSGCYFDIDTTGDNTSNYDAIGLTTSQMQGSAAATNMAGFDFSTVWTTTSGYPDLIGQIEPPAPPAQIASIDPASVSLTAQEPAFSVGALVASVGYGSVTTTGYAVNGSPSPVSSTVDGGSLSASATGGSISAGSVAATLGSQSMTTAVFDVDSTPEPITSPIESDSLSLSAQTVTPLPESMVAAVAGDSLSVAYQQPSVDVGTIRAAVETGNILLEPQSPHVLAANVSTTLVPGTATLTENELLFQLRPIVARVEPAGVSLSPYSIGIRTWLSDYEYDSFDVPVIPYSITIEELDEIDTSLLLENPYEGYTLGIEDILNDF